MYTVDLYLRVRLACHVDGLSQREAASRFGIARETVRKMLRHSEPPGYRRRQPPKRPKLAPFTDIIDRILEEDRTVHRKQHHTAKRIFDRHFPANLQIHGNRIYIAPPRELHSLRSPPMTRLWRADHVRKAIWQRFPPSRHTSPVFSTLPSISSAYAGTGLRRRSSIKAKIFWNKIFDTATSASWNVT